MNEAKKKRLKILISLGVVTLSAFMYFLAIRLFINPQLPKDAKNEAILLSSGVSGICLIIVRMIFENAATQNMWFSILYFSANIPLFFLGYRSVGKKFTLYSIIHVGLVSILTRVVPQSVIDDICSYGNFDPSTFDPLSIALFAGILSGISTGIVFKFGGSGGGMDIVVLFLAIKKGISAGHYLRLINSCIIITGGILLKRFDSIFYTVVYLFTLSTLVDIIHIRNKKTIINVITNNGEEVADMLVKNSPHSCTIFEGKGAYSKKEKAMLYMVVSSFEVNRIVTLIKDVDPNSFISVSTASLIFGRFYMPPLE